MIETATYQFSYEVLKRDFALSEEQSDALLTKAVDVVEQAVKGNDSVLICASLGPYGAMLADGSEFSGSYIDQLKAQGNVKEKLKDYHRRRLQRLAADKRVRVLIAETLPSVIEAEAVCELVQELKVTQPLLVSFSCKNESQTCYGDDLAAAASALCKSFGSVLHGIGVNCTDPRYVLALVRRLVANVPKSMFVMAYPNRGEKWNSETRSWCEAIDLSGTLSVTPVGQSTVMMYF